MPLFFANYVDPALKQTFQVPVLSVDVNTKKALILHNRRDLIVVDMKTLTWSKYE